MEFGVQLPHLGPLVSGPGTVALARHAEALGFASVWVGDHIAYPPAYVERFGPELLESVTTLAYVAASTNRIRVGAAVLVLPYRNPLVLARQLATIDVLSGGRLLAGVGVGYLAEEFRALGVPFAERGAMTDEYIRIIRAIWTEDTPRFDGRYFQFSDLVFAPRPVQRPAPPIWVGGWSQPAFRRAATLGDGWLPIWHKPTGRGMTAEALRTRVQELHRLGRETGRPRPPDVIAMMPLAILDQQPTDAEAQPLVGPPDVLVETLRAYRAAGVRHVILSPYYGLPAPLLPKTLADVERLLERFVGEVRSRV